MIPPKLFLELEHKAGLSPDVIAVRFSGDAAIARVLRLEDEADADWEVVAGATYADGIARFATNRSSVIVVGGPPSSACVKWMAGSIGRHEAAAAVADLRWAPM